MPWTPQSFLLLVLMISSGLTSVVSYLHIRGSSEDKAQIVSQFPLGESIYGLRFKEACFGNVRFKTDLQGGSLVIEGSGSLRVKHHGVSQDLNVELQASFNALRQLGGSYLKIQSEQLSLLLATLNIRPIEVTARVLNPTLGTVFHSKIAGPIEYTLIGDEAIAIRGLKEDDSLSNVALISGQPLFKELSVIQELEGSNLHCDSTQLIALDLAPILMLFEALARLIPKGLMP